jgi:hypothetical protein
MKEGRDACNTVIYGIAEQAGVRVTGRGAAGQGCLCGTMWLLMRAIVKILCKKIQNILA